MVTYSKIAAKGIGRSILIIIIGYFITFLTGFIAIFQSILYLEASDASLGGGHAGGEVAVIAFLIYLALHNFAAFLLLISIGVMPFFYMMIANKYSIEYLIHGIWKEKAEELILPKIKQLSKKAIDESHRLDWLSNKAILKIELLNQVRQDPESKGFKRRVLNYLFRKSGLDEIDFSIDKQELPNAISIKISEFIREKTKPSWRIVWVTISIQFLALIISQFYY